MVVGTWYGAIMLVKRNIFEIFFNYLAAMFNFTICDQGGRDCKT